MRHIDPRINKYINMILSLKRMWTHMLKSLKKLRIYTLQDIILVPELTQGEKYFKLKRRLQEKKKEKIHPI